MASVFTQQPEFLLDEEGDYITITVPAPLSRPNSAVVVLEKNVLTFDCPPYLLKLKLPRKVSDEYSDVTYDDDRSSYTIKVKKDLSSGKTAKATGSAGAGKNASACPATIFAAVGKVQSGTSTAKSTNASVATKASNATGAAKAASVAGATKSSSSSGIQKAANAAGPLKPASVAGTPKPASTTGTQKPTNAAGAPKAANAPKPSTDKKESVNDLPFAPMRCVVGSQGKDLSKPKPKKEKSSATVKNVEVQFYGFGNLYSKMFGQYYTEFYEVIDVTDPDNTTSKQRTDLRVKEERDKFNIEHYLADLMEPDLDLIDNYFKFKPVWVVSPIKDELRDDEVESLEEIHKKEWLKNGLPDDVKRICELQLVDVLFGYAYNNRITEGDRSVASAWNITKISSTLSWFETFQNVKDVMVTSYRRMITYPLCRSWKLADVIKQDVVNILKLGPKQVTSCLLETRDIFNETDNYYVLNTLYLNDMCHFAYNMTAESTKKLSEEVQKIRVEKHEVNEDLPILECAAHIVATERNPKSAENKKKIDRLTKQFQHLKAGKSSAFNRERSSSESSEGSDSSYEPVRTRGESEDEYPESESGESCSGDEDDSEEDVLDDDDEDDAEECEKGIADLEIADDTEDEE